MWVSLPENDTIQPSSKHANKAVALSPAPPALTFLNQHDTIDAPTSDTVDNNQRFSHLLSIMPAGVLVVDKKGTVSLANQQAINLLGEPLVKEAWRDVIARVFTPKDDDGHEVSMRNGKKVKIDISPLTEEKGQLIVITDLTETRQLQTRMGHMQRLSSLGKMVASLAHQVRTPLSSALLYAENLKAMPLHNEMATRFSEKLTLRLKELESQVNDMLLFAKSSDNQIVSLLDASEVLHQAIAQTEAQLGQAGVRYEVINPHNPSSVLTPIDEPAVNNKQVVLGNVTALTGALTNLITNAMQALEQQRSRESLAGNLNTHNPLDALITLSVSNERVQKQDYCVFTVADNGKGLSETNMNRLFEPFFTTKSQGTGLGLAVVNTVAKSHKGFAKCGNMPNGGAFFSLFIPNQYSSTQTESVQASHLPVANELLANQHALTGAPHE